MFCRSERILAAVLLLVEFCTFSITPALADPNKQTNLPSDQSASFWEGALSNTKKQVASIPFSHSIEKELAEMEHVFENLHSSNPLLKQLESMVVVASLHQKSLAQIGSTLQSSEPLATHFRENSIPTIPTKKSEQTMLNIFNELADFYSSYNLKYDAVVARNGTYNKEHLVGSVIQFWKTSLQAYEASMAQIQGEPVTLQVADAIAANTTKIIAASILMTDHEINESHLDVARTWDKKDFSTEKEVWAKAVFPAFATSPLSMLVALFYTFTASNDADEAFKEKCIAMGITILNFFYFLGGRELHMYARMHELPFSIGLDNGLSIYTIAPSLVLPMLIIAGTAIRAASLKGRNKLRNQAFAAHIEKSKQYKNNVPALLNKCNVALTVKALPASSSAFSLKDFIDQNREVTVDAKIRNQ